MSDCCMGQVARSVPRNTVPNQFYFELQEIREAMAIGSGGAEGPFLDYHSAELNGMLHCTCSTTKDHFGSSAKQGRVKASDRNLVDFASHTVEQDRIGAYYKHVTALTAPSHVSRLLWATE